MLGRSLQQALERYLDPTLHEPHDRIDLVSRDREPCAQRDANRSAQLFARGRDPARRGRAMDTVQCPDPVDAPAMDNAVAQQRTRLISQRGDRATHRGVDIGAIVLSQVAELRIRRR